MTDQPAAPTPPPYHVTGSDDGPGQRYLHIGAANNIQVLASMNPAHPDTPANAKLFAAAPDTVAERDRLRVVIEGLVGALEDMTDRFESALEATHATRIDRQEIRAARVLITEARK